MGLALLVVSLVGVVTGWFVTDRRLQMASVLVATLALAAVAGVGLVRTDAAPSDPWPHLFLLATGALVAIGGGGPTTTLVFTLIDGAASTGQRSMAQAGQVLRGGAWIGALERAAVFATLIWGWPEGLAVVLGLKGLGRYPELRSGDSSGIAERFIIGTFTSVLWAAACAGSVLLLL
ncbi:conserved membrane hypothetical protein [metagenome]|uniref:Uncharacterized protein n=1 Tax=metagenome TaxID=256318 RepID=A0A2P2BVX7_9ZZZZ